MRVFFVFAVLTALIIYAPGLTAPFHLDDTNVLQISQKFGWQTRTLGFASFWLNDQILQVIAPVLPWTEPFYHRMGNVLIHAFAATALFWLTLELGGGPLAAAIAGTLFLVHPIQTQAVTYITQRFESQAAMFMLFSAGAYARLRRTGGHGWIAAVVVFGAAGGLTKETALVLPAWLLLIELVFFGRAADLKRYALYFSPLLLILLVPIWYGLAPALGGPTLRWVPWQQYFLTQGPILTKYFGLIAWPRRLFLFYEFQVVSGFSWLVAAQWLLVLCAAASGFFLLKRKKLAGFGILSFFLLLLPVMVLPLPDLINEHRVYPAFAGVAMAAAVAIESVRRKWLIAVVAGSVILPLGVRTAFRNSEWKDPVQFMELHRAAFPHDASILTRLAAYYYMRGQVNKALELNLEARRFENNLNTYYRQQGHLLTSINLAAVYAAKRNFQAAKTEAMRAIAAKPSEPLGWLELGKAQLELGENKEAQQTLEKLVALSPSAEAWESLRVAASRAGDFERAEAAARQLKAEEGKARPEQAGPPVEIPKKYRPYAIFVMTLALLGSGPSYPPSGPGWRRRKISHQRDPAINIEGPDIVPGPVSLRGSGVGGLLDSEYDVVAVGLE